MGANFEISMLDQRLHHSAY